MNRSKGPFFPLGAYREDWAILVGLGDYDKGCR